MKEPGWSPEGVVSGVSDPEGGNAVSAGGGASIALHDSSRETLLLDLLRSEGTMTMDQVAATLPRLSWGELFLVVDRLSRRGELMIRRRGFDYELRVGERSRAPGSKNRLVHPDQ